MPDNPRMEYIKATMPAPQPGYDEWDGMGIRSEALEIAAGMARVMTRRIIEASGNDGTACLMMLRRAGGMTLEEIAAIHGVTKQAVRKRFVKIVERYPEMEGYLHVSSPGILDEGIAGYQDILEIRNRHYRRMRELATWMNGRI